MKLLELEIEALKDAQDGREVCLWRVDIEFDYRIGRAYRIIGGTGMMTIMAIHQLTIADINLKDIKRSGYKRFADLMDQLRTQEEEVDRLTGVWEIRVQPGDIVDRPRLLQHSGRKSGDYTSQTHRAMRGEADPGEALSDWDLAISEGQTASDRRRLENEFRSRVAHEAQTLFRGADSLRNFERVLDSLGADAPGRRKRGAA